MKKVSNELWQKLLGFQPNEVLKKMILQSVHDEGLTLEEACTRHAMPGPVVMLQDNGTFQYHGETHTPAEWEKEHPCQQLVALRVRQPQKNNQ